MDDISFTTFLKLCLRSSTTAKANELQKLHSGTGGYDFYKRLKLSAQAVANGEKDPTAIILELATIKREAERTHNIQVANEFLKWWKGLEGATGGGQPPKGVYRLPWMVFGIRLVPELRYLINSSERVSYLWAIALPKLTPQVAAIGLQILRESLGDKVHEQCKFEIRDLRGKRTFEESVISNSTQATLQADLAMINSLWSHIQPKAV